MRAFAESCDPMGLPTIMNRILGKYFKVFQSFKPNALISPFYFIG